MNDKTYVSRDFIYGGVRRSTTGGLLIAVHPVTDEREPGQVCHYDFKPKRDARRVVGGIYKGTEFTPNNDSVKGLTEARYSGMYRNSDKVMEWEAIHDEYMAEHKAKKSESLDGRITEIEKSMAAVRKLYADALARHDMHAAYAIERSVLRALKNPPYAREKEER